RDARARARGGRPMTDQTLHTFDCPNCGLIAVTSEERCPDAALARICADLGTGPAMHDRQHLHGLDYVPGCATCRGALECSDCGETYYERDHVIDDHDPGLCPTCAVGG